MFYSPKVSLWECVEGSNTGFLPPKPFIYPLTLWHHAFEIPEPGKEDPNNQDKAPIMLQNVIGINR